MIFTSFTYACFFIILFFVYWNFKNRIVQNVFLLFSSYVFLGWVHPWFSLLLAFSALVVYLTGLGINYYPGHKKLFLLVSVIANLGVLGFFKYFNFFAENICSVLNLIGLNPDPFSTKVLLPVGISFFTFQALAYSVDVYKGDIEPRKNFVDLALFISFFPQLVAGPIERAKHLLPQIEKKRSFDISSLQVAGALLLRGYLKKLVIADNVAVYADKIFMLNSPSFYLLLAGALAFTLQIYADFSAYTDMARGFSRLLGFTIIKNFNSPYLAVSPSDFWRRWHISFSTWIRDYLYLPLGGSKVDAAWKYAMVLAVTLGLSGLWHGAAWNFVIWGFYHAVLAFAYWYFGMGGRWMPANRAAKAGAWALMFCFIVFGWLIFRVPNIPWLVSSLKTMFAVQSSDQVFAFVIILLFLAVYSFPLFVFMFLDRVVPKMKWVHAIVYGFAMAAIFGLCRDVGQDFIYFQF